MDKRSPGFCMKDEPSVGVDLAQSDVDRLCNVLAAIVFDWWRRQAHEEAAGERLDPSEDAAELDLYAGQTQPAAHREQ